MEQLSIFDIGYFPENKIENYQVRRITCEMAREYICKNHYAHGCHKAPSPCYGLFEKEKLIGCCMFATPCSENVRASIFGEEYKDNVIELHRFHILDVTPRNTESWFIAQCFRRLIQDRPQTWAVISFSDTTEGHEGTIYKATNFYRCGKTGRKTFYIDSNGRLHHPRQNGHNVSLNEALERGWKPIERETKNRYIMILGRTHKDKKIHELMWREHYKGRIQ